MRLNVPIRNLRFQYLEEKAKAGNKDLKDMSLEEMDVFWNEAKLL